MKKFNINYSVKAVLNSTGADIINNYYDNMYKNFPGLNSEKHYKGGDTVTMQFWELMRIFGGDNIDISTISPFKDCHIWFDADDLTEEGYSQKYITNELSYCIDDYAITEKPDESEVMVKLSAIKPSSNKATISSGFDFIRQIIEAGKKNNK